MKIGGFRLKADIKLFQYLFLCTFISILFSLETFASPNQEDSRPVGYVNVNNETLHFWNSVDDYYLNYTSGIQFTNNKDDYWTKNVFCAGIKISNWQFYCNDNLPFSPSIATDNETYINITYKKDILVGLYAARARLVYNLKVNDVNLTINPSFENIGSNDINKDLAFAWKIKDIEISTEGNDFIYLNNSFYDLNEDNNLFFNNLSYTQLIDNDTLLYKEHVPYFKLYDNVNGKYLRLDWKSTNYNVTLKSSETNPQIILAINLGTLPVGSKKSAFLYWIDAGSQYSRPDQDLANPGAWATSPLYSKIDETSYDDSDYIQSPLLTVPKSVSISLSSINDPGTTTGHYLRYRKSKDASAGQTVTLRVRLYDGSTLIKEYSSELSSTTWSTTTLSLTEAEAAKITNYNNLSVEFNGSGAMELPRRKTRVSWVEFEVPEPVPEINLTYDNAGNLVKDGNYYYEYNNFNQLKRIRQGDSTGDLLLEFYYDHEGKRIKKIDVNNTIGNTTTYYIGNSVKVVTPTTSYSETYYYDGDTLVAMKDIAGNMLYYHPDHLGSTTLVTNQSGDVVERVTYEPFGSEFSSLNNKEVRYDYNSKESDNPCLLYYGARYYNPCGPLTFTQPDLFIQNIYDPQNLNRYSYVRNNPYKYTDPTGNEPVTAGVVITYTFLETGIDVISIIKSAYDVHKNPEGVVNQIAFSLDVIDLLGGPVSYPGPSGLTLKLVEELTEEQAFDYLQNLEKENPEKFKKLGKYTTVPINELLEKSAQLQQQNQEIDNSKGKSNADKKASGSSRQIPSQYKNYYEYLSDLFLNIEKDKAQQNNKGDDKDGKNNI